MQLVNVCVNDEERNMLRNAYAIIEEFLEQRWQKRLDLIARSFSSQIEIPDDNEIEDWLNEALAV